MVGRALRLATKGVISSGLTTLYTILSITSTPVTPGGSSSPGLLDIYKTPRKPKERLNEITVKIEIEGKIYTLKEIVSNDITVTANMIDISFVENDEIKLKIKI